MLLEQERWILGVEGNCIATQLQRWAQTPCWLKEITTDRRRETGGKTVLAFPSGKTKPYEQEVKEILIHLHLQHADRQQIKLNIKNNPNIK